ncbi:UvrD-helicase domain-containing protein [Streptomyces sp. NPDC059913]|uniref:UvrD-helicase domain-containing protein n=1 Tax=unclassified Streptomyces TaxID=2593676 RepID=UPI0036650E7F
MSAPGHATQARGVSAPIAVEAWRPSGIEDLEPAAWAALRDTGSVAVVAGPGAGKTEFLAQRATYLLQTATCPSPRRILAISFKRDAAANLARRVAARVPEHADRFDSMTFDAFTKGLVDRFTPALPQDWRMTDGYDISYAKPREIQDFLNSIAAAAPAELRWPVAAIQPGRFAADVLGRYDLPEKLPPDSQADAISYAARQWWQARYLRPGTAQLDFVMLNRLAELLVRAVPKLRRALRMTYPFVFVDELQDTTSAQFSFLQAVFGEKTTVTAVGDSNQRIMGWAGALPEAAARFTEAFGATRHTLTWNFRSSDALVELQHIIATKLDPDAVRATSKATAEDAHDSAALWTFSSQAREAAFLADWIARDIADSNRQPSDFALIARQKIREFEPSFRMHLGTHGIRVRNDDARVGTMTLQDLLKSETASLLLGLLRLADEPHGLATIWRDVTGTLERVHGAADDEAAQYRVGEALTQTTTQLRSWLRSNPPSTTHAADVLRQILSLVDADAVRRYTRSMPHGEDFDLVAEAFEERLAAVIDAHTDWRDVFDEFESADAVVLLTAHRSKGLEYHTVAFLGIHQEQWWAYGKDRREGTSTFFVGLSRAAHRLIFTTDHNDRSGPISDLFSMLTQAGVPEIDHG